MAQLANPLSLLLSLVLVPLVWSVFVQVIRHVASPSSAALHDTTEKTVMAVMVLPTLTSLIFQAVAPFSAPLTQTHMFYPPVFDEVTMVATQTLPRLASQSFDFMALGVSTILFIYVAGLIVSLWRLWQAHNRLAHIVKTAQPTALGQHVLRTEALSPAFAWDHQRIIVPAVLFERLSATELELILAHERAHQGRADPLYFLALSLIEALFWFNPLFAKQAKACRLAAELSCDAIAVGDESQMRKTYAQTLMIALKHAAGCETTCVPAVLSDKDNYKVRLSQILTQAPRPRKAWVGLAAMFTLAAPVLMLQMAFAGDHKLPVLTSLAAATPSAVETKDSLFHTLPVDYPVSSGFGMRKDPTASKFRAHGGVDFEVPVGTPVKAPASGTVTGAGVWGAYGQVVEIDHGSGIRTLFAHLSQTGLKWGDHVSEGQVIALSGNSGQSSHPHLHMEVRQSGKRIDPATVMAFPTP